MWTRRQFLSRSGLGLLGTAGTCLAVGGDSADRAGRLLLAAGVDPSLRGEQLSISDFVRVAEAAAAAT